MPENAPYFHVALNLPHAGRVARRILLLVPRDDSAPDTSFKTAVSLYELLSPYFNQEENPAASRAAEVRDRAAMIGRKLVDQIEREKAGHDRLGQCIRNLFECLELGQEGAAISLRAGEDPKSFQRPF